MPKTLNDILAPKKKRTLGDIMDPGSKPSNFLAPPKKILDNVTGGPDDFWARQAEEWKGLEPGDIQGTFKPEVTPRTLRENIANINIVDILAHLPFSPLQDYEKKGKAAAERKLQTGDYGQRQYALGGHGFPAFRPAQPKQTADQLTKIVKDYQTEQERGQTVPAAIGSGIADLPSYIGEFVALGPISKAAGARITQRMAAGPLKSIVGGGIVRAGAMVPFQPHRVKSALIDQIERGETGPMAYAKAWGDVYIEDLSEMAGEGLPYIVGKMPFGGRIMSGLKKFATKTGMSVSKFWQTVGTKAGYNGLLAEWAEEDLGTFMRALTDVQDFGAGPDATWDQRIAAGFGQDYQVRNMLTRAGVLLAPLTTRAAAQKLLGPMGPEEAPEDLPPKPIDQSQFDRDIAAMDAEQKQHMISIAAERPILSSKTTEQDVSGFLRSVRGKGAVAAKNKIRQSERKGEIYDQIKAIGWVNWKKLTNQQKVEKINQFVSESAPSEITFKQGKSPKGREQLIAEKDGKYAGDLIYEERDDGLYVQNMNVPEAFRRQGVMTDLIKNVEQQTGKKFTDYSEVASPEGKAFIEDVVEGRKGLEKKPTPEELIKQVQSFNIVHPDMSLDEISAAVEFIKRQKTLIEQMPESEKKKELLQAISELEQAITSLQKPAAEKAPSEAAGEKIKGAAYYNPNTGQIAEGRTHAQAAANMEGGVTVPEGQKPVQEGFVTSTGRFVTNEEATEIAQKAKQLPEKIKLTQEERILGRPTAQRILTPTPEAKPTEKAAVELKTSDKGSYIELESIEAKPTGTEAGTKAIQKLIDTTDKPIRLTVAKSNTKAQALYKRLGFDEITPEDPKVTGIRMELKPEAEVTDEELGGITKPERRKLIKETADRIKRSDIYQGAIEAIEDEGRQVGGAGGLVFVGESGRGEVQEAVQNHPRLKFHITFNSSKGVSSWDQVVQEMGAYESGEEMGLTEFLERYGKALESTKQEGGLSTSALDIFEESGLPHEQLLAQKHRMLVAGYSDFEINNMISEWAEFNDQPPESMEEEYVSEYGTQIKQIKKMEPADQDAALEQLATQQIEAEERSEAARAAIEVLEANDIVPDVREVEDISDRPADLLGRPVLRGGATGKQRGLGELGLEFKKPEVKDPDQLEFGQLPEKPADDIPFERRSSPAAAGRPVGAAITQGQVETILLAYGADSETGYHEAYHILRRRLTDKDRQVLDKYFKNDEEAEARAFAKFAKTGKARTFLKGIWQKLVNILKKVKSGLQGRGFRTAENVFDAIHKGTVEKVSPKAAAVKYERQSSHKLLKEEFGSRKLLTEKPVKNKLLGGFLNTDGTYTGIRFYGHDDALEMAGVNNWDLYFNEGGFRIVITESDELNNEFIISGSRKPNKQQLIAIRKQIKAANLTKLNYEFNNYPNKPIGGVIEGKNIEGKLKKITDDYFGQVKYETSGEKARREVEKRARIRARKARLAAEAGVKPKKVPKSRFKIKINDKTPLLKNNPEWQEWSPRGSGAFGVTSIPKQDPKQTPPLSAELYPDTLLDELVADPRDIKIQKGKQFFTDEWYKQNIKAYKDSRIEIFKDKAKGLAASTFKGIDYLVGASSTRLYNIHPELFRQVRRYVYNMLTRTTDQLEEAEPFLKKMKHLPKEDYKRLDLALKNSDKREIDRVVDKYEMREEYEVIRDVLNDIYAAAKQVGIDMQYKSDYWHRELSDPKGFLKYFQGTEYWSIIEAALQKRAERAGRTVADLTVDEKAQVVNTLLRGFRTQALTLSKPGAAKERTVDAVFKDINHFYDNSETAIVKYIKGMNAKIAEREFFGKETKEITDLRKLQSARLTRLMKLGRRVGLKEGTTEGRYKTHISKAVENYKAAAERLERLTTQGPTESIGRYVMDLQQEGKIRPDQEQELQNILIGIFHPKGFGKTLGGLTAAIYIDTLGSPLQALTQLDEFSYAMTRSPSKSIPALVRGVARKSRVTPRDIGITSIGKEFQNASMKKALTTILKTTGFEEIDRINKEIFINTALAKMQDQARKKPSSLNKRLARVFGSDYKQVIKDLQKPIKSLDDVSDDVKYLLFNDILDIQPLAVSEMPEAYNRAGKARIFYILKTFYIKRMDFVRNESFKKMKHKETFAEGFGNLVWLMTAFALLGAGSDFLKDFIKGRAFSLSDSVIDSILRIFMSSKFQVMQAKREGAGRAIVDSVFSPPTKAIDAVSRDIISVAEGKDRGFELWRSVPVGGELYYWWFGAGADRNARTKKGKRIGTE